MTVHEQFAHPVPDALSDDAAALLEPMSVGLWAAWPAAIALATSGLVELDRLVTGHYGLAQVGEALSVTRSDPKARKPVVRPWAS